MRVKPYPNQPGYNHYQDFQFSRMDRKLNTFTTKPQTCKEVFATMFRPTDFEKGRFRIIVLCSRSDKKLDAAKTENFLNQVEATLGFSKSKVWDVSKSCPVNVQGLVVDATVRWGKSSPLLHLFLLLARNGSGHDPNKTWQHTLAKFRRTEAFKAADTAQFVIIKDVLPHILAKKGRLENLSAIIEQQEQINGWGSYYASRLPAERSWQLGRGICQWARDFQVAKEQKLVEVL